MAYRLTALSRGLLLGMALIALTGCTRFENHASLSRHSKEGWSLTWTTVVRRGFNLVDSSGNVGSASATFRCRPDPGRELTWIVEGPAVSWQGNGAANRVLGPPSTRGWQGTATLAPNGEVHALTIDLHDIATGRPFVGNRRFENARGNGESWFAN